MAIDGISRLIAITQMKSSNANDEAMASAQKQRALIDTQKNLQADQRTIAELKRGEQQIATMQGAQKQAAMQSAQMQSAQRQAAMQGAQMQGAQMQAAQMQAAMIDKQISAKGNQRKFAELTRGEQQIAAMELQVRLAAFQKTLSPPAAALLDQWLEWAALHR